MVTGDDAQAMPPERESAGPMPGSPVTVLGLGGGGSRVASCLCGDAPTLACKVIAADTDMDALRGVENIDVIQLGGDWTNQKGCGGDTALGERAASTSAEALNACISGSRLLIVVAALGGGTGSGAARVVGRLAREARVTTLFLATLPFAFEGNWRRREAEKSLQSLREMADSVIVVPNDLLFTAFSADTPATEAFCLADSLLARALTSLIRLNQANGLIPADFSSFRTVLRKRPATNCLGVGHGSGEQRWQKALDALLDCPLLGGRLNLQQADAAVISILGGPDLAMGEIQSCLSALQEQFGAQTRIIAGAYASEDARGLQITALVCRYEEPRSSAAPATRRPAPRPRQARNSPGKSRAKIQGELPLIEQSLGIFAGTPPTTVAGQNLDVPTFQRKGISLDVGD